MTELQINLTVAALTLVITCSVGALAQDLVKYLDKPGTENLAVEYQLLRTNATAPMKSTDADKTTEPAPPDNKVAMK